jgi:hypothetical protein
MEGIVFLRNVKYYVRAGRSSKQGGGRGLSPD